MSNITYNVHGANARFNYKSADNSSNVVRSQQNIGDHISLLRDVINESNLNAQQKQSAQELINAADTHIKAGNPKRSVISTLLAPLPPIDKATDIVSEIVDMLS